MYKVSKLNVSSVPLELKYSSAYYRCPCGTICVPRFLEILIHKLSSRTCYLALSDFQLNIFAANRKARGVLLDRVFIRSIDIYPNSRARGGKSKRKFTINVYKEAPSKSFAIHCCAEDDFEMQEWQRAFLIFQRRESRQVDDIIDMYLDGR